MRDSDGRQEGQGGKPPPATPKLAAALATGSLHPVQLLIGMPDGLAVLMDKFVELAEGDRKLLLTWIPDGVFADRVADEWAMRGAMD